MLALAAVTLIDCSVGVPPDAGAGALGVLDALEALEGPEEVDELDVLEDDEPPQAVSTSPPTTTRETPRILLAIAHSLDDEFFIACHKGHKRGRI